MAQKNETTKRLRELAEKERVRLAEVDMLRKVGRCEG